MSDADNKKPWMDSYEYAEYMMARIEEEKKKEIAMATQQFCEWRPYRFFPWVEWRSWEAIGQTGAPLGIYGIERRWRKST